MDSRIKNLSNDELAAKLNELYEGRELINALITGLEEQAFQKIQQGELIPGYCVRQTASRKTWIFEKIDEIELIGQLFNVELKKPIEYITVKQAVDAGISEEFITNLVVKTQGTLKLDKADLSGVFKNG